MVSVFSIVVCALGTLTKANGQRLRMVVPFVLAIAIFLPSFGSPVSLPSNSTTASLENVTHGSSCPEGDTARDASCKILQNFGQLQRSQLTFGPRLQAIVLGWVSDSAWETYPVEPGLHPPQSNRLLV